MSCTKVVVDINYLFMGVGVATNRTYSSLSLSLNKIRTELGLICFESN